MNFVMERVKNIVGKGENAGYQHFLLFPQCFQKASFSGSLKNGLRVTLNFKYYLHGKSTYIQHGNIDKYFPPC